jgi:cyclophilin family peptidyl-prolyl cis-trans isomerase
MARSADPDSAGSQWFITEKDMPGWVHAYTAFGQVVDGMEVVKAIQRGDRMLEVHIEYVAAGTLPAGSLN